MSTHNTCFVAQIVLNDSTNYYVCSSTRMAGMTLDGNIYYPYILSIGDSEKVGNFGEGSTIGKGSITLLFGQKQYQGAFNFDISKLWSNGTCTVKIRDIDNDSTWAECEDYYKGVIKNFKINNDNLSFDIDDTNIKDNITLPKYTVEDIVEEDSDLSISDIPENSVGKYIPMQFGDLSDTSNGIFAKGLLISNKIGFQKIFFDNTSLYLLSNIGMWENGTKRYFTGNATGEYTINTSNYKSVRFYADSECTLDEDLTATEGIETFKVSDWSKLEWKDESDYNDIDNYPEVLSVNVIAIDSELMLLVEQPSSDTIRVERGYNGTTEATHSAGAKMYQCAKFSAKNLLSFSETFFPKALSNFYYNYDLSYSNPIDSGVWNNVIDIDTSNYIKLVGRTGGQHILNIDLRFEKIESDFTCYGIYVIHKTFINVKRVGTNSVILRYLMLCESSDVNSYCETANGNENAHHIMTVIYPGGVVNPRTEILIDTTTSYQREYYNNGYIYEVPNLLESGKLSGVYAGTAPLYVNANNDQAITSFKNLSDLNKKWKLNIGIGPYATEPVNYIQLYRIGFLIDFFSSIVDKRLIGSAQGRKLSATAQSIVGAASSGTLATSPIEILALILTDELGYTSSDFDTTSWQATYSYWYGNSDGPSCAMSWGIDDKEKGWDLCQNIASQFNLMLTKTSAGKIKIVNLYQLQDTNVSTGYKSLTAYKISIDDIIISGGKRQISIQQTGTDRIRNTVKINYKRNNSTDEYQGHFPGGEQGLTKDYLETNEILPEDNKSLSSAKSYYFGGETEILEIDAFAIYNYVDAYRLWQWNIRDKAELFFYVTLTIPYYHYYDINSKSTQYDIGDIIYIDGKCNGLELSILHKWIIRNITLTDQGREIIIEAKSIEPVIKF